MSQPDYSKDSFFRFVDYVSKKGLIKQATASNWRNASTRLLALLEEDESTDLRKLDIDGLCSRFMNLEGKSVTPSSMQVYRSRLKNAVGDFITYTNNPMGYKPGIEQRSARKKAAKIDTNGQSANKGQNANQQANDQNSDAQERHSYAKGITFPIPLRADLVVEIRHLPHDLTPQEAERISMVIKALAMTQGSKE